METLEFWKEFLEEFGYTEEWIDSICGIINSVDFVKNEHFINVFCFYDKEYLDSLPNGEEYTPDYSKIFVKAINIDTDYFGYPEGHLSDGEFQGGILLQYNTYSKNFHALTVDNFKEAYWMYKNPISAKIEILRETIYAWQIFKNKFSLILQELGWKEDDTSLLKVGNNILFTEPQFYYKKDWKDLIFSYNIFSKKLVYLKILESSFNKPPVTEEIDVNNLSNDEFKQLIIDETDNNYTVNY